MLPSKLRLEVNSARAVLYAVVAVAIAAISTLFEVFSFGWIAWCALALLAIVVLWSELFETGAAIPTASSKHAGKLIFAVIFAYGLWVTSMAEDFSRGRLFLLVAGIWTMESLADLLVGRMPRQEHDPDDGPRDIGAEATATKAGGDDR
jgi:hypothetical protein